MPIRFRCPECATNVVAADEIRGKMVRCAKCRATFRAEETNAASSIQQAPAPKPKAAPRPAPAARPAPPPALPRTSPVGLILGVAAAGFFLVLLIAVGVGVGAWLLWPRAAASPSPSPVTAIEPAAPQPPAVAPPTPPHPVADVPAPAPVTDATQFHPNDVRKSVVFIRQSTPGLPTSIGSGFFVTADGVIATNRHVIQPDSGPNPATVLYVGVPSAADPDVLDYFKAQVAFCPPVQDTLDFALVKIAARPGYQPFRPLPLAPPTTKLDLGAPAAVVGFPLTTLDKPVLSFNKGSISATRKEIEGHPYYQTDAAVNHGNSGGPLINTDGQVVGLVSRKRDDANNMGYALYLNETGLPSVLSQDKIVRLQAEAGPLDPKQLPASGATKATRLADWQTHGTVLEDKGLVIAENGGGSYWLTNNNPLPENFQLDIECAVVPLVPDQAMPFGPPHRFRPPGAPFIVGPQPQLNMNILGSLYVRFGTDAVDQDITSMNGTTVHLSAAQLQVAENGTVVQTQQKGVPHEIFLLTVTRRGDQLTAAVNGVVWATQKLQYALQGPHKFSIGGLQSGFALVGVTVTPVDGPAVPPPLVGVPPKPVLPGAPAAVAFDAGWDKPVDPDGDCKVTPNQGALTIEAPAKRHDLSVEQNVLNAPRLLRDVTGDFIVQVKVTGDFQPAAPSTNPAGAPFLGAGLIATADDRTFCRLERAAVNRNDQTDAYVNWEGHAPGVLRNGSASLRPNTPTAPPPPATIYLRLRRQGDRFFPAYSIDGTTWTEMAPMHGTLPAAMKVGVAVVTTSAAPFKASFEDFRLGASGDVPPPPPPPPVDPKTWAAQPAADWKGPAWTNDPGKMKAPDDPPAGWLMGAEFKADDVSINPIGWITFRQGQPGAAPRSEAVVILREHSLAELEGKTITVTGKQDQFPPIMGNATRVTAQNQAKVQPLGDFFMKLEFGKLDSGKLPGTIYLCLPDDAKSVVAGHFVLEKK